MSITDARTLPKHSHLPEYTAVAGCHTCARLGLINPDTLTPWPSLDDHGQQVLADADRRFNDRYDGLNHEAALEAAVKEAYLRGRMQGRQEQRKDLSATSDAHLANALSHLRTAADAAEKGDVRTAATHASLADLHTADARVLAHAAGSAHNARLDGGQ
jgi:hypothetical protein